MTDAFDVTQDPAVLMVNPSEAYRSVSLLPDEMIRYEPQGLRSANTLGKRRAQLSDLINKKTYKPGKQPVAMGIKEDLGLCNGYVEKWSDEIDKSTKSPETINAYLIRTKFMERRIDALTVPSEDEESKEELLRLKRYPIRSPRNHPRC